MMICGGSNNCPVKVCRGKNLLAASLFLHAYQKETRHGEIIIVDDEQEILTPLEEMLSEGFKVRSF